MFLLKLIAFEFGLLLKDRVGALWTFVFPVLLAMTLVPIYSSVDGDRRGTNSLVIDACGTPQQLQTLEQAFAKTYDGGLAFTGHHNSQYLAEGYRIDLLEECRQPGVGSPGFSGAEIIRYKGNSQWDGVVSLVVGSWLNNSFDTALKKVSVLDYSLPEQRMSASQFLVSGIMAITLTSTCLFGVAVSLVNLRAANLFKKYRLFPASTAEIVLSLLFSRLLLMFAFCLFFIFVSFWHFDIGFTSDNWLPTFGILLLGILTFTAAAIALSNFFSSPSSISPFTSLLYITSIIIGNIFFPIDLLPDWVNRISEFYPVRVFADAFRSAAFDVEMGVSLDRAVAVLFAWLIAATVVGVYKFRWHAYSRN